MNSSHFMSPRESQGIMPSGRVNADNDFNYQKYLSDKDKLSGA